MNSVEAARVLAVLDEGLQGLRLLSAVTPEILESAGQVKDVLDGALGELLLTHRAAVYESKGQQEAIASSWQLWRFLKRNPSSMVKLQSLQIEPSHAVNQLIATFERLQACAHKQLTTSVEEDKSNQEHFQEVKDREERAFSEKTQLEQKLKLQRIERQKQLSTITVAEEKARSELAAIQRESEAQNHTLDERARQMREEDSEVHASSRKQLTDELLAAKVELEKLHEENRELEIQARKAKTRAEHEVEAIINSFDEEMTSKEQEYQEALKIYNGLQCQIEEYIEGIEQLTKERLENEAEQRRKEEEKRKMDLHNFVVNRAAKVIQRSWTSFKASKEAEKKKSKKDKGGKKGKK